MFNDFNELFSTKVYSAADIFDQENVFEPRIDYDYTSEPLEFNDIDLELIEPYDTLGLSLRKNSIRERYTAFDQKPLLKKRDDMNWDDISFTTFDKTDVSCCTPIANNKNEADNLFEQSFISEVNNKQFKKRKTAETALPTEQVSMIETSRISKAETQDKENKKPKKRVKEQANGRKPLHACKCTKSKCLRLYCECFAKGLICGVDCDCRDCHNTDEHKPLRELVIQETLEKNPYAFKSKYKRIDKKDSILHSRGCNCSKTGCVKEYCECFKAGTGCSRLCRCSNCQNQKIEIEADEVKIYYDRVLRKRKKRSVLKECFSNKLEILRKMGMNFN